MNAEASPLIMEFRTHARARDGMGLRIRWPAALRSADIKRVLVSDQLGDNPAEHFMDFELVNGDNYDLTITLRPQYPLDPIQRINDIDREDIARRLRFFGRVRYREAPQLLLNIDNYLGRLTPSGEYLRGRATLDQEVVDRWTYLPSAGHFDCDIRATRPIEKSILRPEVTMLDVVDHLVSDRSGLWYYDAILTAEYKPRD